MVICRKALEDASAATARLEEAVAIREREVAVAQSRAEDAERRRREDMEVSRREAERRRDADAEREREWERERQRRRAADAEEDARRTRIADELAMRSMGLGSHLGGGGAAGVGLGLGGAGVGLSTAALHFRDEAMRLEAERGVDRARIEQYIEALAAADARARGHEEALVVCRKALEDAAVEAARLHHLATARERDVGEHDTRAREAAAAQARAEAAVAAAEEARREAVHDADEMRRAAKEEAGQRAAAEALSARLQTQLQQQEILHAATVKHLEGALAKAQQDASAQVTLHERAVAAIQDQLERVSAAARQEVSQAQDKTAAQCAAALRSADATADELDAVRGQLSKLQLQAREAERDKARAKQTLELEVEALQRTVKGQEATLQTVEWQSRRATQDLHLEQQQHQQALTTLHQQHQRQLDNVKHIAATSIAAITSEGPTGSVAGPAGVAIVPATDPLTLTQAELASPARVKQALFGGGRSGPGAGAGAALGAGLAASTVRHAPVPLDHPAASYQYTSGGERFAADLANTVETQRMRRELRQLEDAVAERDTEISRLEAELTAALGERDRYRAQVREMDRCSVAVEAHEQLRAQLDEANAEIAKLRRLHGVAAMQLDAAHDAAQRSRLSALEELEGRWSQRCAELQAQLIHKHETREATLSAALRDADARAQLSQAAVEELSGNVRELRAQVAQSSVAAKYPALAAPVHAQAPAGASVGVGGGQGQFVAKSTHLQSLEARQAGIQARFKEFM